MLTESLNDLAAKAGVKFFDYQQDVFEAAAALPGPQQRVCLYHRTGAGKTITALVLASQWGYGAALVVAPPSTHSAWVMWGRLLGVEVTAISHAKFRMKDYKISRETLVIVDEFHLLGGHTGKGWMKLDRLARGLQAPLIVASATPNYNDAERVYCIQHVLDPHSCKGGFLEFLYTHCVTEQDPFSMIPKVLGFQKFPDAEAYLAALPGVFYLPDELVYSIVDVVVPKFPNPVFETLGYDARSHRMVASEMERRHKRIFNNLVNDEGTIRSVVYDVLEDLAAGATTPVLIYADHSTVADALGQELHYRRVKHAVVTGKTPPKKKEAYISAFRDGVLDVLVGTASLATGTDGLDKVCDVLIILDDTTDDSLRRQLIGRIMPRGADADATKKQVYRLLLQ